MHRWLVAGALLLVGTVGANAQSWPSKPVRFIIPVTAGSAVDITARTIADHLSQQLGQPFIVENRTGAGGTVGMGYVAKSVEPDGYTVLVHSAAFVIQPSTFPNLGFDGGKDFAGVTLLAPLLLAAMMGLAGAQRLDGFNVIVAPNHPFGSRTAEAALGRAKRLGATAVAIVPFLWQPGPTSPTRSGCTT